MAKVTWNERALWKEVEINTKKNLKEVGRMLLAKSRRACPVGIVARTTQGKDWKQSKPQDLQKSGRFMVLTQRKPYMMRLIYGNKKTYYAYFVEKGTVNMRARPFMRQAFQSSIGQIRKIMDGKPS